MQHLCIMVDTLGAETARSSQHKALHLLGKHGDVHSHLKAIKVMNLKVQRNRYKQIDITRTSNVESLY